MSLAKPHHEIKAEYEVVVVGSGYGGAIAASRFARAGKSVCVMERGKEFEAGDFPDTELEAAGELQIDLADKTVGDMTGLYQLHSDDEINVLHGCGLGGTSLINANVSLKPEPSVFASKGWPEEIGSDLATSLEDGYRRATEMLRPTTSFPDYTKLKFLQKSAQELGKPFIRTPINVNFEDFAGGNHVGVPQAPCVECGDCVSGCNHTAKNTTAMNYLPDARNHGAHIFCEVLIRRVEKNGDRWRVFYKTSGADRKKFDAPDQVVVADVVVLGAGCLGTTEILLRSMEAGLVCSDKVGHGFSGNGDAVGFNYNADERVHGIGFGHRDPEDEEPVGPCITGALDARAEDGVLVEEGVVPGAIAHVLPLGLAQAAGLMGEDTDEGFVDKLKEMGRETASIVRGPYHGAIQNTQIYLAMAHDDADGRLRLQKDRLRIAWPGVGKKPVFEKINAVLRKLTSATGGTFVKNPIWSKAFKNALITVHPLGGCIMGTDASTGVVNHKGQVFSGTEGTDVYKGLCITDGSVIPTSLGVNPLLTISALAERSCALIAAERGWTINYDLPSTPPAEEPIAENAGVVFTETMGGFLSTNEMNDYQKGFDRGKEEDSPCRFVLTIRTEDVNAMIEDPDHLAHMIGTVEAPALCPTPLTATEGTFKLFRKSDDQIETKEMIYRMKLAGEGGRRYFFVGFKTIRSKNGLDLWADTTTLYITIHKGDDDGGAVVAKGTLHINPRDFAKQMTTMKAVHPPNRFAGTAAIARFGAFFAGELWGTYGGIFVPSRVFADVPVRKRRPLRAPAPEVHQCQTDDGVVIRLTRYNGGNKGPVVLAPGFSNSASVFMLDTTETSFGEYLVAHGYDVWLFDRRSSPSLPGAATKYSFDDIAKYDWPTAIDTVLGLTGSDSAQVVAHCMGSMTFLMARMLGMTGIRSAVCSQVTTHFYTSWDNELKAASRSADLFETLGINTVTTDVGPNWGDAILDGLLRLYPRAPEERCDNPVCRRIFGIFGPVYHHANLNRATHRAVGEVFGIASTHILRHMTRIFRKGYVVDFKGNDIYMPNLNKLDFPIHFIAGLKNQIAKPRSSKRLLDLLHEQFGRELHTRRTFEKYAHMDCFIGTHAAEDIFPNVLKHLDLHSGG